MDTIEFETPTLDETGQVIQRTRCTARMFVEVLGDGVALEMITIPGGIFQMGSPPRHGNEEERPLHWVTIAGFTLGRHLITQEQWEAVTGWPPECRFKGRSLPVERVSWQAAASFCKQLSKQTGRQYRLPTEAQWEYACRAGTRTPFSFGETLTAEVANYVGRQTFRQEPPGQVRHCTSPAGTFPPNPFGLCDMHGNLWEWCEDNWHEDYSAAPRDGGAYLKRGDVYRAARGGSWHDPPESCRSAARVRLLESDADEIVGFRVCLVDLTS